MNELLKTLSKDKWKRIGDRRRAGVLAPLFSVYSKKSVGIGDFADLKILVDWCAKTGNSILQLLPMNEIGPTFCPYDAVSSFALEPSYIALEGMPVRTDRSIDKKIAGLRKRFPTGAARVDYGIKEEKEKVLRAIYLKDGAGSKEFKKFVKENSYWLDDFALFKVLKSHHGGRPWYEWEDKYKTGSGAEAELFSKEYEREIVFQKWVQWIAASQFKEAKAYASSRRVLIKGDLPILISRDSADAWAYRKFFKLKFAAGAPPDMYCAKGQRWGVPTYDWDKIEKDGYRYLKAKLGYARGFYDILRIDHVVGLFRIWSIPYDDPAGNEGLNGLFDPRDENEWEAHGKKILSAMLESTDMLLCAEDLGIIPKVCPQMLEKFGMPGNDVQRWMKDWKVAHDFLRPDEYRLIAVTMLSTHDTTNWPAWWENEAGTVNEALFIRKALDRKIDYASVQNKLFDPLLSRHGRLKWLDSITSTDMLVNILGKKKEELSDFIDMYENSYKEKERLWKHLKLKAAMKGESGQALFSAVLQENLNAKSIFCIQLLIDYLYLGNILKGDPYQYRINRPGTVSKDNWSLVVPLSLEELLRHKACKEIKNMVSASGR